MAHVMSYNGVARWVSQIVASCNSDHYLNSTVSGVCLFGYLFVFLFNYLFAVLSVTLFACFFACLFVWLSVCLFVDLFVCSFVCLSLYLLAGLFVCFSVRLVVCLLVYLFTCLLVFVCLCLFACLSVCLFVLKFGWRITYYKSKTPIFQQNITIFTFKQSCVRGILNQYAKYRTFLAQSRSTIRQLSWSLPSCYQQYGYGKVEVLNPYIREVKTAGVSSISYMEVRDIEYKVTERGVCMGKYLHEVCEKQLRAANTFPRRQRLLLYTSLKLSCS